METVGVAQQAVELWGPVGGLVALIMIGGFMALKWLAARDDIRNQKMDTMLDRVATVVANNTAAMQNLTASHDELREAVLDRPKARLIKLNGRARA